MCSRDVEDSNDYIAYRYDNYYITKPYIDKITICGTPPAIKSLEDKRYLNDFLFFEAKCAEESNPTDCLVERMKIEDFKKKPWLKTYKNHFKITPPGTKKYMTFFFDKGKDNPGQRFLRMELNPRKIGREGVEYLIQWYNQTLAHNSFKDIASLKGCINQMDIAVDIVGVHISDLILNMNKGKTNQWHSEEGLLETCYFNAKKGVPSKIKMYNKAEEDKDHPYGEGVDVTRLEFTVKTTLSLSELSKLNNPFVKVEVMKPKELPRAYKEQFGQEQHYTDMFLDTVRFRGQESALARLPEELRTSYRVLLTKGLKNITEDYCDINEWRQHWHDSLLYSGLMSDF